MKTGSDLSDVRPHPGPLPQERGNRSPRFVGAGAPGFRLAVSANEQQAETARAASKDHQSADACSLSPGERVRVRAGVLLTLPGRIRRRHGPRVIRQGMRRARLQLAKDGVPNHLFLPAQPRVPEPKLLDAHRGKESRSFGVMGLLVRMSVMAAVELDRETGCAAVEIEEVGADGMPTAELVGAESPVTQPAPHEFLCPRRLLAQGAGAVDVSHESSVTACGLCGKNGLDVRPHPGPLPQERGNRSPRFVGAGAPGFRVAVSANEPQAETARAASEYHQSADACSLSPGERARVRAGVPTDFKTNQPA